MVQVDLITGFLGAGKTTFLRRYVRYLVAQGHNVCILENDFGAVNVDAMLPETLSPQAEYVLASETANAGRVLVSRTQLAGQQQTAAAVAHLTRALEGCKCSRRFAPEEIITKDWARLTDADLAAIAACGCRQASCEKLHFDEHEAFSSLCFLEQHLTLQQLQAAADHLFADAACGHVLRVKGFAPDPQGTTGWLELNATAAGRTLEPIPQGQDVLIVIGEGLDKAAIEARLKACIINTKTTEW